MQKVDLTKLNKLRQKQRRAQKQLRELCQQIDSKARSKRYAHILAWGQMVEDIGFNLESETQAAAVKHSLEQLKLKMSTEK